MLKNNDLSPYKSYIGIYSHSFSLLQDLFDSWFEYLKDPSYESSFTPTIKKISSEYDLNTIKLIPKDSQSIIHELTKIGDQLKLMAQIYHPTLISKEIDYLIYDYVKALGLHLEILDFYAYQLSGGMIKKIAIIMVLLQNPKLIVAQDIISGLDTLSIQNLFSVLKKVKDLPQMVFLSQEMLFVRKICSQYLDLDSLECELKPIHFIENISYKETFCSPLSEDKKTTPLIEMKEITFAVTLKNKKTPLIKNINLSLNQGESLGLVGKSGSGKSTIAKVISGVYQPQKGSLYYQGQKLKYPIKHKNHSIHLIFQNPQYSLNQKLKVKQAILEPLSIINRKDHKNLSTVMPLWDYFELDPSLMNCLVADLPLNIQQLIAIIRAFIAEPKLIICDEIFTPLNEKDSAKVIEHLTLLQNTNNTALIIINHDLRIVQSLCQHTAIIEHGQIIEYNDTPSIFNSPEYHPTQELVTSYRWFLSPNE